MKKLIKDWWPLLLIAGWWLWKKAGKANAAQQEPAEEVPQSPAQPEPAPKNDDTPVVLGGGSAISYKGKTFYVGGTIGKTVYDDMAAERAKHNSCPVHGTSTMRHIHTYNGGHVEDYYQCTVCGHRNTVYVK